MVLTARLVMPRSPLAVFLKACRMVSTFRSPPKLEETGLWAALAVGNRVGDMSNPLKEVVMLVGGEVPSPCEEDGEGNGDGDWLRSPRRSRDITPR